MTEADLGRIEAAVGCPLPTHYRNFLRDHGDKLRAVRDRCPDAVELYLEADKVIGEYEFIHRRGGYIQWGDDLTPWPEELLVIGGFEASGDHLVINLDTPRERIWAYHHQGGYLGPPDFATWAEYLEVVEGRVEDWERYVREHGAGPGAGPG